jgi:hypothetical protein
MLEASKLSFDKADSTGFIQIFSNALTPHDKYENSIERLKILTIDDLIIGTQGNYDYYDHGEYEYSELYEEIYRAKINKMDAEKAISDAKVSLTKKRDSAELQ